MICKCKDWVQNIRRINAPIEFEAIHTHGPGYEGKFFVYCPWCGKELEKENEKK